MENPKDNYPKDNYPNINSDLIGDIYQLLKGSRFSVNGNAGHFSESVLRNYIEKGGQYITRGSNGVLEIDVQRMVDDRCREKYREEKLKQLATIARELSRLNDKKELESFVKGLTEKNVEKKSLD